MSPCCFSSSWALSPDWCSSQKGIFEEHTRWCNQSAASSHANQVFVWYVLKICVNAWYIGCRMRSDKAVQQKVNSVCYCLTIGLVVGRQSLLHTQMLKVKDFCSHIWKQHGHLQCKPPWTMSPMLLTMMGLLLLHTFHVCWEIICTPFHYLVSGQTMHFPTTTMLQCYYYDLRYLLF